MSGDELEEEKDTYKALSIPAAPAVADAAAAPVSGIPPMSARFTGTTDNVVDAAAAAAATDPAPGVVVAVVVVVVVTFDVKKSVNVASVLNDVGALLISIDWPPRLIVVLDEKKLLNKTL